MAVYITIDCIGCQACVSVCPNRAIRNQEGSACVIPHRCDECTTSENGPQCGAICPVEEAIVFSNGIAVNPAGSLKPNAQLINDILNQQEV